VPTDCEHKAAFDRHVASYADTVDKHPDWAAVMLFYCAVHMVERLFAFDQIHNTDHGKREFELKSRYQSLWPEYRVLKSESLKTRYLDGGVFVLSARNVKEKLHGKRLVNLVADIESRLAARGMIPPAIVPPTM